MTFICLQRRFNMNLNVNILLLSVLLTSSMYAMGPDEEMPDSIYNEKRLKRLKECKKKCLFLKGVPSRKKCKEECAEVYLDQLLKYHRQDPARPYHAFPLTHGNIKIK